MIDDAIKGNKGIKKKEHKIIIRINKKIKKKTKKQKKSQTRRVRESVQRKRYFDFFFSYLASL